MPRKVLDGVLGNGNRKEKHNERSRRRKRTRARTTDRYGQAIAPISDRRKRVIGCTVEARNRAAVNTPSKRSAVANANIVRAEARARTA